MPGIAALVAHEEMSPAPLSLEALGCAVGCTALDVDRRGCDV